MGQIGTRIGHTVQQGTVVDLDDLAKVAQGANQKGHIRLKETGGGLQIYGHASGTASMFHRRNAERQDAGTEMVARSVLAFAEGKGPAVMEKARQLIEPFVQGGNAIKRMTNADVVQIEREMRSFATKEQQSLKEAVSDIREMSRALHRVEVKQIQINHQGNLFDAFRGSVEAFVKIIDVAKAKYPDRQDFLEFSRDKGLPELRAGFVLGALDDLRRGFDLGPREMKVFKALLEPFADPDTRSPVDDLFDRYKDNLHEDGRFDDLACEVSDLIFKNPSAGSDDTGGDRPIYSFDEPVHLYDVSAQMHWEYAKEDGGKFRFDSLQSAFFKQLSVAPDPGGSPELRKEGGLRQSDEGVRPFHDDGFTMAAVGLKNLLKDLGLGT